MGAALCAMPSWAASYYTIRPDDPKAVYLTKDNFPVRGDGVADDTAAIQQAIDKANGIGVVLIPEGRYRISKTIFIGPGVRVFGYGAARPTLLLAANTPGYQNREAFMIFFGGGRRGGANAPALEPRRHALGGLDVSYPGDSSPGTFYSAMSNIDIEIGEGNPQAVAIRGRYAQHCYLAHMEFRLGSAMAGIHDIGNAAEDLRFIGGQYGIMTRKPSPGWQFTLVDSVFEGQKVAAIQSHEAGLTLIHPTFRKAPTAIAIDSGYIEELWLKNGRMEDITGPAIVIGREHSLKTEINMEGVVCSNVPVFAQLRESGKKYAGPSAIYEVKTFSHGLHYADLGADGAIRTAFEAAPMKEMPPDRAALPTLPPRDTWVNVRDLGLKGDGKTDDTAALRAAIAAHRALYFPIGQYLLSGSVTLRPDTVLVGLHPSSTALILADSTPAFQGLGNPVPVIEAPKGGINIMAGLGIYTNGINPRAVALKWMAGADSMVDDVRFLGGHGTNTIDGVRENPYNNTHTADPNLNRRWDGQYPSLWVTDGGGGTFFDIWTPSTFAQAGMLVSDTATEGRVYQMSSEHHVRSEVVVRNASNWRIYSLQTEEERGEGGFALPLEIDHSSNITVANMHIYRVVSMFQPFPYGILVNASKNIRLRNIHCYSDSKASFDHSVFDGAHNVGLRQREFAWMDISGNPPATRAKPIPSVVAAGSKVQRLAGGFYNISGIAVAPSGDVFFVDPHWQKILRWSAADRRVSVVRDSPLDPVNLAFDKAGNLLVVSYAGRGVIYAFSPDKPGLDVQVLKAEPSAPRAGMTPVLPVNHWRWDNDFLEVVPVKKEFQFVSPDGSTFIPAGQDFINATQYYGTKMQDVLRAFGLAKAAPGKPFYVTDEAELQTYAVAIDESGTVSAPKLFAHMGGEGLAVDANGNVYLAAGQIFVYSPEGKELGVIEVPERPTSLAFGGSDGKTLFITARTSLYSVRIR